MDGFPPFMLELVISGGPGQIFQVHFSKLYFSLTIVDI